MNATRFMRHWGCSAVPLILALLVVLVFAFIVHPEEKRDVVAMLRLIAGPSAERLGAVRDGLGRLSSSLLQG
jgi:hypothetical protein